MKERDVQRTCPSRGASEGEDTDRIPDCSKRMPGWYCSVLVWMRMAHHAHLDR